MQIFFVLSLLFAILVSVFAVMNSDTVTIKLLWKQYQFSQAIVILGSAAVGAIIVALLGVFSKVKSSFKIRELNNRIKTLEKEIDVFKPKELEETNNENINKDSIDLGEDNIDVSLEKHNTLEEKKEDNIQ